MADGEVKIRVTQETQGTSLKDAKRDAEALKNVGGGSQAEVANERAITREHRERDAIRKAAGHGHGGFSAARAQQELTTLIREMATGMPSGRTTGALIGALGVGKFLMNPMVLAGAAAIGAYSEYVDQKDQDRAMQQRLGESRSAGVRGLDRADKYDASTSGLAAKEIELREKIAANVAHRQSLLNDANSGMMGHLFNAVGSEFFTKGWGWYKPKTARALEEHDAGNAQDQELLKKTEEERQKKQKESLDLERASTRANVNFNRKEMRRLDDQVQWNKDYYAQLALSPDDPAGAAEFASNKTAIAQRDRAGLFARLVNGKSGAADVAAAAALSREQRTGSASLLTNQEFKAGLAQHMAPLGHMSREQFKPRLNLGGSAS